ncbi:hypothetical protein AB0G04_26440 [Actinoplanes sp. NPDC023801]|uniref:hypothetical protein n=1 Tax=Actinoplanes sp. NPDC023801 TaxID=3154595 RepID=UPI0033D954E7
MTMSVEQRFGTGTLSQGAAMIYTLLAVELALLLTAGPGLTLIVLLEPDASNLPLAALCALPAGPALSAALYAIHHRRLDLTDLRPGFAFRRGYRLNVRGALVVWAAWLAWVTILGMNLTGLGATGLPGWWAGPLVLVGTGATLWMLNALVITSLFVFRTRDVVRLSAYLMIRCPGVTVSNICLLVAAAGGVWLWSEAALALAGSLLVLVLLGNSRQLITVVRQEYTR